MAKKKSSLQLLIGGLEVEDKFCTHVKQEVVVLREVDDGAIAVAIAKREDHSTEELHRDELARGEVDLRAEVSELVFSPVVVEAIGVVFTHDAHLQLVEELNGRFGIDIEG